MSSLISRAAYCVASVFTASLTVAQPGPIVGVDFERSDFGTLATPEGWNRFGLSAGTDETRSNLLAVNGQATATSVRVIGTRLDNGLPISFSASFSGAPLASDTPSGLTGIGDYLAFSSNINARLDIQIGGLIPGAIYDLWLIGTRVAAFEHSFNVNSGALIINQSGLTNQVWINGSRASSAQPFESYAVLATANPQGLITVAVTDPNFTGNPDIAVAGLAVRLREVPAACGTADFDQDGDTGTDADIEAFFQCLAGTCCTLCGTADFDQDGDTGTDADIEAFFRVLAGGPC